MQNGAVQEDYFVIIMYENAPNCSYRMGFYIDKRSCAQIELIHVK